MTDASSALVSVDWLSAHLQDDRLVVLDASQPPVVPGFTAMNAEGDFRAIAGARRFDYDKEVCRPNSSLPHMMPSAELFTEKARALGIDADSVIVVYDDVGLYASPRAWWMFRAMGHEQVYVLNGGLPAWVEQGLPVTSDYGAAAKEGNFTAGEATAAFCDAASVLAALEDSSCAILDARSSGRFHGVDPEPRAGLRGGHMPNARSLPCLTVLNGGYLKPVEELRQILAPLSAPEQRVITSCGSGITACILTLAAYEAGYRNLAVYDGSWVEWGSPSHLPVVTD